MNHASTTKQPPLIWLIVLLIAASLACAQAGEVMTPQEATARAEEALSRPDREGSTAGEFQPGDTAALTGRSFLVNIMDTPAGRISAGQERGAVVTVLQATEVEGDIWYQIEAPTGSGWVRYDSLEAVEGEEAGPDDEEAAGAIPAGETVTLSGRSFLVNLYDEPGGRISAGQERGATVTVLGSTTYEGVVWYQIDAPTGQGWVPEENISTEAP